MSHSDPDASCRRFVRAGFTGVAALQVGALGRGAAAAELPRLEESDPTAKALAYMHDASSLDAVVVEVARHHARQIELSARYEVTTAAALVGRGAHYDVVLNSAGGAG